MPPTADWQRLRPRKRAGGPTSEEKGHRTRCCSTTSIYKLFWALCLWRHNIWSNALTTYLKYNERIVSNSHVWKSLWTGVKIMFAQMTLLWPEIEVWFFFSDVQSPLKISRWTFAEHPLCAGAAGASRMPAGPQDACCGVDQRPTGWEDSFKWVSGNNLGLHGVAWGSPIHVGAGELSWSRYAWNGPQWLREIYTGREERGEGRMSHRERTVEMNVWSQKVFDESDERP